MKTEKSTAKSRFFTGLSLATMMAFVAGLSIFVLSKQSLRLDEAQSLWQSSHAPADILYIVAQDVHVPLYHLILHFWIVFFGSGVMTARYLSLVFALLTIPSVYLLARQAYSRNVALFATLMISISPFLNWYSNEIRMYSLMTLFTVLNYYFFLKILRKPDVNAWWGFYVTAAIGVYTHYFFLSALAAEFAFLVIYRHLFERGTLKRFLLIMAALIVELLPWALYVISLGSADSTRPSLAKPSSIDLFNTFSQFLFGFQNNTLNTTIISLWPVLVLFGFFSLQKNKRSNPETVFFFITASFPILAAYIFSLAVAPLFLSRYLILAIPSLYLFIAWLLSNYPRRVMIGSSALLLTLMITTLGIQTVSSTTPVKENYREVTDYLEANAKPQDVIIVSAPFTVYPVEYYYQGSTAITTLPIWNRFQAGPIPPFSEEKLADEVATLKSDHRYAYVILSYDQGYEQDIRLFFDSQYERVERKTFSPGLTLYVYKLRYD